MEENVLKPVYDAISLQAMRAVVSNGASIVRLSENSDELTS